MVMHFTPVLWSTISTNPQRLKLLTGTTDGFAQGINNNGNIVGYAFSGNSSETTPIYWSSISSEPKVLSLLIGTTTYLWGQALGINNNGYIVGMVYTNESSSAIPVYWSSFTANPLRLSVNGIDLTCVEAPVNGVYACGITDANFIVGLRTCAGPAGRIYWDNLLAEPIYLDEETQVYGVNDVKVSVGYTFNGFLPTYWTSPTAAGTNLQTTTTYNEWLAFGINNTNFIVGSANTTSGDIAVPIYWSSFTASPLPLSSTIGLFASTNCKAYGINDNGIIVGFAFIESITPTPVISNICFPAGTPIRTDQGIVNIDQLDPAKHTFNKLPLKHITKTRTLDKYLISFPKGSIRPHLPSQHTIMTKDHNIEFNGCMVPAYRFLTYSSDIKKVKYNGEILYNVLLAKPGKMIVNDLVCETLHPENIIAKLYTNKYTETERSDLVMHINESLTTRDFETYKKLLTKV